METVLSDSQISAQCQQEADNNRGGGDRCQANLSFHERLVPDFAAAPWERSPSWTGKDYKAPSAVKAHLRMMVFNGKLGF